jgi:competence ComEA-like helix-hairpin-helix protein
LMVWWATAMAAPHSGVPGLDSLTLEQLDALPMLGPEQSRRIVEWRQYHGPCRDLEDLLEVPGFGPATVAALRGLVNCAGEVADPSPEQPPPGRPSVLSIVPIDVNHATAQALTGLPGITLGRATAIVAHREQAGPFGSCEDLVQVAGIGPATVANLRTGDRAAICLAL